MAPFGDWRTAQKRPYATRVAALRRGEPPHARPRRRRRREGARTKVFFIFSAADPAAASPGARAGPPGPPPSRTTRPRGARPCARGARGAGGATPWAWRRWCRRSGRRPPEGAASPAAGSGTPRATSRGPPPIAACAGRNVTAGARARAREAERRAARAGDEAAFRGTRRDAQAVVHEALRLGSADGVALAPGRVLGHGAHLLLVARLLLLVVGSYMIPLGVVKASALVRHRGVRVRRRRRGAGRRDRPKTPGGGRRGVGGSPSSR